MKKGENGLFLEKVFSKIPVASSEVEAKKIFKTGVDPSKKMKSSREALKLDVYKINENFTFQEVFSSFGDLNDLYLSRGQIAGFYNRNREKLSKNNTFFLTKKNDNFLVVPVNQYGPEKPLDFKHCGTWLGSSEHFVVIPNVKKPKQKPLN